jgi:ribosomal-protein-serine acetyltransferase
MAKYNFPETLITDRFILEAVTPFHAEEAYEVIDSCREYLGEFLPWCTPEYSLEDTESFYEIQQQNFEDEEGFQYAIIDRDTDSLIGCVGLDIKNSHTGAIGYWLAQDHQGKGVMNECLTELKECAFKEAGIVRLNLYADLDNIKSQKVAEKAGFVFEGISYSNLVENGTDAVDVVLFATLADETKMQKLKELEPKLKEVYGF